MKIFLRGGFGRPVLQSFRIFLPSLLCLLLLTGCRASPVLEETIYTQASEVTDDRQQMLDPEDEGEKTEDFDNTEDEEAETPRDTASDAGSAGESGEARKSTEMMSSESGDDREDGEGSRDGSGSESGELQSGAEGAAEDQEHGTYITDYAEKIGFGSKKYELIDIDR